tara:strand:+ start:3406 stop:3687 length:282 start_codon:yes stop_codon:yes gene_type:complete
MIDRQGNMDDSREDDALLHAEEQAHIEECYAEVQKLQAEIALRPTPSQQRVPSRYWRHWNSFNIIICDDPRRYDPWPTTEDYNATSSKFTGLA